MLISEMEKIGFRKIVLLLLLLDVFICIFYRIKPYSYTNSISCGLVNEFPIGEIIDGLEVDLYVTAIDDNFSAIDLLFGTYARDNKDGVLVLEIFNDETLIQRSMINTSDIVDNSYLKFEFPTQKKSKNKEYLIKIYSQNCGYDNAVTLWATSVESNDSSYGINNSKSNGTIIYSTEYKIFYRYTWEIIFFAVVLVTIYTLIPSDKDKKENK